MTSDPPELIGPDQVLWSAPEDQREGRPLLVLLHRHGMDERRVARR